ncbi:class I SAM-dependent methyltransferase [Arthrobacter sp.]|uniref:class I SAM-dependent methyltransferase n=1 Tax=Arthrobacter sp. TaxID=1667 RepID=UPI003A8F4AD2
MNGPVPPDFAPAPNQAGNPGLYEVENRAIDHEGTLRRALGEAAGLSGKVVVDLGCGSGFWLRGYAAQAASVIGVEPDPSLLELARARVAAQGLDGVQVLHGSAEHLPLADGSVDVVHARFAYFFPTPTNDCTPGLREVLRVLRPGGTLVVIDNDQDNGQFAAMLRACDTAQQFQGTGDHVRSWWARQGAETRQVMSSWSFETVADRDAVLHLEFPADVAGAHLAAHPGQRRLSYGYLLHCLSKPSTAADQPLP